jgi:hypothetical protein
VSVIVDGAVAAAVYVKWTVFVSPGARMTPSTQPVGGHSTWPPAPPSSRMTSKTPPVELLARAGTSTGAPRGIVVMVLSGSRKTLPTQGGSAVVVVVLLVVVVLELVVVLLVVEVVVAQGFPKPPPGSQE